MKIGYARVSTDEQNLDAQLDALKKEGCEMLFFEKVTGSKSDRAELLKALSHLRKDDTLVVWKLDRLGRTLKQLIELMDDFKVKNVHFKSIQDAIDTSSPIGQFFFHVMGAFAELERELIRERTKAGLASARSRGRLGGRPELHNANRKEMAYEMYMKNDKTVKEIADALGMGRTTIYRYILKRSGHAPA